jgi:hypothetical protein
MALRLVLPAFLTRQAKFQFDQDQFRHLLSDFSLSLEGGVLGKGAAETDALRQKSVR